MLTMSHRVDLKVRSRNLPQWPDIATASVADFSQARSLETTEKEIRDLTRPTVKVRELLRPHSIRVLPSSDTFDEKKSLVNEDFGASKVEGGHQTTVINA